MQLTFRTISLSILFVLFATSYGRSQSHTIKLHISNQPDNPIFLGWISGDDFQKTDSAKIFNGTVKFEIPEDAHTGVYRAILGQTGYARVMDEDPQILDFIFNGENIELQTDFKKPTETLKVIQSAENQAYFDFMNRQREYEKALLLMEKEVDLLWNKKDTASAIQLADEFNRLQMEWDLRIVQTTQQNDTKFASKLIAMQRQALKDGFLSPAERKESFKKDFFKPLDFSDEQLIYSAAYTDKVFEFLVLFNDVDFTREQRVEAYLKGVDQVLKHTTVNAQVHQFIKKYLIHGFEVLEMEEVVNFIKESN